MQTSEILAGIDEEISRLRQVRNLLTGSSNKAAKRGGRAPGATASSLGVHNGTPRKRRKLSAAGRARIAAAQKARWAKLKKAKADKK